MSIQLMTQAWRSGAAAGQKMVLLALCDNANDHGECRPSVSYLARKCSMGERTVQNHITTMEESGILRREFRTGRSTFYFINAEKFVPPQQETPPQNSHPAESAPPQNLHHTPAESAPPPPQNLRDTPAESAPRTINEPSKEPSGKQKKAGATADPDFSARDALLALRVGESTIRDWLIHRKAKKAAVTETVVNAFIREAGVAGVTVEFALQHSIESNWVGFSADWYAAKTRPQPVLPGRPVAFNPTAHVNRNRPGMAL